MGGFVPFVVAVLLKLHSPFQWAEVAVPAFFGWCIAEFIANVLAKPRLANRTPGDAIREWDQQQRDRVNSSASSPKA